MQRIYLDEIEGESPPSLGISILQLYPLNFTYQASGQLIITNLPVCITIQPYVKPPIQNILNGSEEPFIVLKFGD